MNLADLRKPFPPERISWRVGSMTQDKTKGMALAYIDARDVMGRLEEVCGDLWQCEYMPMPNGTCCCRLGIKVGSEWIWRANGAMNMTDSEKPDAKEMAEKGSYSDAFKRAAVLWGVGRYLYDIESPWVALDDKKRIVQSEYARLRKLLEGGSPQTSAPVPAIQDANERAAAWVAKAEKEVIACRSRADMAAWMKANLTNMDRLQTSHKALWNALNMKIALRNDELEMMPA